MSPEPVVMNKPQVTIRPLAPTDASLYRDIRLEGLEQHPEAFSSTFDQESGKPLAWFAERITLGNVLGACAETGLLGVAGFWPQNGTKSHKAALWGMYVRPAARGFGIGQGLVEAILDHASGQVEQLYLSVVSDNEAAYRLYRRLEFSEYGRELKALKRDGRYFDEILMARFLAPDRQPGQNRM
jgi:RimJ/RimL family protein N-acetyltransferase